MAQPLLKTLTQRIAWLPVAMIAAAGCQFIPSDEGVEYPFPTQSYRILTITNENGQYRDPAARKFHVLFRKIHHRLLTDSLLTAYRTDSGKAAIPHGEFRTLGAVEEVIKVPRSDGHFEWEEDSIIYTRFDPADVEAFLIAEHWQWDGLRHQGKVRTVALAPMIRMTVEGVDLRPFPLYWVRTDELSDILSRGEAEWMRKYLYYTLVMRVRDPEYLP